MKKASHKKLTEVLAVLSVVVFAAAAFLICVSLNARILKNNIGSGLSVYVPNGMANRYDDHTKFSFDDCRVWWYDLKEKEDEDISAQLENGKWKKSDKGLREAISVSYFELFGAKIPDDIDESFYYCFFDFDSERKAFVPSSDGEIQHRLLIIYDKESKIYCCVLSAI